LELNAVGVLEKWLGKMARMNEKRNGNSDPPSSFVERWGYASAGFWLVALVGAVYLFGNIITELWPGNGTSRVPDFILTVLFGIGWTSGALLFAWLFRSN
jgi:hypothetical protein